MLLKCYCINKNTINPYKYLIIATLRGCFPISYLNVNKKNNAKIITHIQ